MTTNGARSWAAVVVVPAAVEGIAISPPIELLTVASVVGEPPVFD